MKKVHDGIEKRGISEHNVKYIEEVRTKTKGEQGGRSRKKKNERGNKGMLTKKKRTCKMKLIG